MNVHNELMKLNFAPSNFETLTNMNFLLRVVNAIYDSNGFPNNEQTLHS